MLTIKWRPLLALLLVVTVITLSGCINEPSTEEHTLIVDVEPTKTAPTVKVYDGGEEIAGKQGNSVQFKLSNGSYTIEVTADGYATETREVSIKGSNETISLNLSSLSEYILTVDVEQAPSTPIVKVYDDGEEIVSREGNSVQFKLNNGRYNVKVIVDGYSTETGGFSINDSDEKISLTFSDLLTYSGNWEPGEGWTLAWADEFDKPIVDESNWTHQELAPGTFNNEWQEYTDSSENCYIKLDADGSDGAMVIEAKYNGNGLKMGNFTSARMITNEKVEYQYGKIAARIKVPEGQGIWPAFWMLGTNISETGGNVDWPWCGEIDIMEKVGGTNIKERTVHGTVHYAKYEDADWPYCYDAIGGSKTISEYLSQDYHVYEIEWSKDLIIWQLDGVEYHRQDMTDPAFDEFEAPFYILLNVAVGGDWPGYPDETTSFPQKMHIDWVRVYK